LLITHRLQPALPRDRITVIHDYPASQCVLAKIRAGNPPLAERFELYPGPHELANGYHELNDAGEQGARFERDNEYAASAGCAKCRSTSDCWPCSIRCRTAPAWRWAWSVC
jgi:lysyl-tRNA synthetase class 2